MLDVPGRMGEGDWKVALFIDERAGDAAFEKLGELFTGKGAALWGSWPFSSEKLSGWKGRRLISLKPQTAGK